MIAVRQPPDCRSVLAVDRLFRQIRCIEMKSWSSHRCFPSSTAGPSPLLIVVAALLVGLALLAVAFSAR